MSFGDNGEKNLDVSHFSLGNSRIEEKDALSVSKPEENGVNLN